MRSIKFITIYILSHVLALDPFLMTLMMNKGGMKKSFDPFIMSMLQNDKSIDPKLVMMLMNQKYGSEKVSPLLPLFLTGKTGDDPMLMTMLMGDEMPDMGLMAEAISDPEGKGAASFFTEMAMKNILGDDLGAIMSIEKDGRGDAMQKYVMSQMGIDDWVIPLLMADKADITPVDKLQLFQWLNRGRTLDPDTIKLVLGTFESEPLDLKQMYIDTLISSGALSEQSGILLREINKGTDRKEILNMIFSSRNKLSGDVDWSILPPGVYPGRKLFFVQIESLGLDSCALVSPMNRYPCGMQFGSDVTAEQCEFVPYCCYNPIPDLDDLTATILLNNPAAVSEDIPKCYYNIFFIFFDDFSLEVQPYNQFPAPSDCLPLYRFGFDLQPEVWSYFQMNDKTSILVNERHECGFPGITKFHCVALRGCCYDENAGVGPACFYPDGREPALPGTDMDGSIHQIGFEDEYEVIRAAVGDCNWNPYKIPKFYKERLACNIPMSVLTGPGNRDPLIEPNENECLQLGCCWETDDSIADSYPHISRCYRPETVGSTKTKPELDDLVQRSAQVDHVDENHNQDRSSNN